MIEALYESRTALAVGLLVVALASVAYTAFKRGEVPRLRDLPWAEWKAAVEMFRREYATRPWPESVPSSYVSMEPEQLEAYLRGERGFEGTPYTFMYEGEVMNLRKPWGIDENGDQSELHLRARQSTSGRLEVVAHTEKSRYEHKADHVAGVGLDWEAGHEAVESLWDE